MLNIKTGNLMFKFTDRVMPVTLDQSFEKA